MELFILLVFLNRLSFIVFNRNFVLLTGIVDQDVEFLMSFELIGDPH